MAITLTDNAVMKILVVDDDVEIVRELCSFLSRRGHEAVIRERLEELRRKKEKPS